MILTDEQIANTYSMLQDFHKKHLEAHGVKLPKLLRNGQYTKDALVLIYLAQDYPDTRIVSKSELTEFIKTFYPDTNDVQQARHLAAQKGWYILSGTRNDNSSTSIPAGSYQLKSLTEYYPGFTAERRDELFSEDYWENLKESYGYRCACCGSKEGERHRYWSNTIVTLQKGHMDPSKPLKEGNIIPQCEKCNRPDKNYWIYDQKGRVIGIANEKAIDSCSPMIKKKIYERLYVDFKGKKPSDL